MFERNDPVKMILNRLEEVKTISQDKWQAKCPAHDDKKPSLSITVGEDEKVLLHCHAGCSIEDICKALGIEEKELFVHKSKSRRPHRQIVARYGFKDENGKLLFQTVREKPKKFWQRQPDGNGGWINNIRDVRRVLYRLPELLKTNSDEWIYIPEGEKHADELVRLGLRATTSPMGAGKWRNEYVDFLERRKVVILPDNDDPGRKHAEQVAGSLYGKAVEVKIISLPGLPLKGDVLDWLNNGGTVEKLLELVEQTEDYQPPAESLSPADTDDNISYRATKKGLVWLKPTKDGDVPISLTNFTAKIVADVTYDDGVEIIHTFEIEASINTIIKRFTVTASRFNAMSWAVENLGAQAIIYPGFTIKDNARAAVQMLSKGIAARRIYAHTGWRSICGQWFYLHANGAIGGNGPVTGIETLLNENLKYYSLPIPPAGTALHESIRACLRILDLAPDFLIWPLFCMPWRAVLGQCSFSCHLAGHTGTGKTELASLIQRHFGPEMHAKNLPASWSSTANALEGLAFTAKDTLLTIDDFAPNGTTYDVQRVHREADRIIRAQGNHSSRQRMRSDSSLRPSKPPRGLILSTGEDVPQGQSLRARLWVLEMSSGDLKWKKLTLCQQDATNGLYAQAMAGFIQWLSPQMDEFLKEKRNKLIELRQKATRSNQHRRTPEIAAEVALGLKYFLEFAKKVGAITADESSNLWNRCWTSLGKSADAQLAHQVASDPVLRFLELISSTLGSGNAHVAGVNGLEPVEPMAWGWREKTIGAGASERTEWQPQGHRIGWIDGDSLYLDPDASYKCAQSMAGNGESISVSARTLRKRLHERGLLIIERSRQTLTVRRKLEGRQRSVLYLRKDILQGYIPTEPDISDNSDSKGHFDSGNKDPVSGSVSGLSKAEHKNLTSKPDKKPIQAPENAAQCQECQVCQVPDAYESDNVGIKLVEDLPNDWRIEFEERAAILQYDGGMTREDAETKAFSEIQARIKIINSSNNGVL